VTKLLVLSDSHGGRAAIERVLLKENANIDALVFLGDGLRDLEQALTPYPRLRAYSVAGNCDYGALEPMDGLAAFDQTIVFYTHGHMYGVKYDLDTLHSMPLPPGARNWPCSATPMFPMPSSGARCFCQPRLLRPLLHRPRHLRPADAGKRQGDRL